MPDIVPDMDCAVRQPKQPIVVALVNDFELLVRGLATMLRPVHDRIEVVELDVGRNPEYEVDVALFDTYGHTQLGLDRVASLARAPNAGRCEKAADEAHAEKESVRGHKIRDDLTLSDSASSHAC